ncbi:hypothetical protein [Parageobacillus thermoglucosidasius]|uniref:Uncharacterized protein n=2 Tax=Parageobacillus galactosidasius TaxID=883812 RepID=A0A226QN43_9BACL|nr:hypothetical protein [Parageobacillus thermoglucosidasius]AEH49131.1 hypothetical protein Geoth_3262 [Parageobacillus thermoglucosidasius C56-YS93]OXB93956.1 hypothetical protein B9L23_03360 [Parageobacillus galactosidasius]
MILISIIIVIGCIIAGYRLWKTHRTLSFISFGFLFAIFSACVGYVTYHSRYHTTPDSLQLSVYKKDGTYMVKGKWKDRLDLYRFPSDFLVFYVPDNEKISIVKRERYKDYEEMDVKSLKEDLKNWLEKQPHSNWEPQIFDIQTDKQFQFSFVLPDNVKPSDVKLYYVHAREEPMDALEYWFKNIELR